MLTFGHIENMSKYLKGDVKHSLKTCRISLWQTELLWMSCFILLRTEWASWQCIHVLLL